MQLTSPRSLLRGAVLLVPSLCLMATCGETRASETARRQLASAATAPRDTVPCTEQALREHVAAARPARASMAEGRVSLVPPEGLPLVDYPNVEERGLFFMVAPGTSIDVSLLDDSVSASQYQRLVAPEFGEAVEWGRIELVEIGGVRWERLGLTGDIVGIEQRTEIYVTPFQGRTLMVNATVAPASDERRWRPRLKASIASLEVRNCRLAGADSPSS
jgi:hypothetical protein